MRPATPAAAAGGNDGVGFRAFSLSGAAVFAIALAYGVRAYVVHFATPAPPGSPWLAPLLVDVALFSAFAIHHSLLTREPVKARVTSWIGQRAERPLYVWLASLLFLLCCAAWQPLPGVLYAWPPGAEPFMIAVQWAGGVVTALAARRLDVFELAGLRPVREQGRRPLETNGLYRIVRHPIYFGWILLVLGTPVMTTTRAVFAGISILYLVVAVQFEERALVRAYGDGYVAYQQRVRARLVPGVY